MTPDLAPAALQTLRTRYGLSQAQIAEYLSVSRAQVSMAEQGLRVLSEAARAKLRPLLPALELPLPPAPTPLDAEARAALQERLHQCTHEAAELRQHLIHLRARAGQYQAVLQELLPRLQPGATGVAEQTWLKQREQEATRHLERNGTAAQVVLELRIEALDYEASQAALRLARAGALPS